jgi:hypothetical protein
MAEVVLQLPVAANEDQIFGRSRDVERMASSSDAPYLMIHTDPALGEFMRILTFQEADAASAFSSGWAQARARTA